MSPDGRRNVRAATHAKLQLAVSLKVDHSAASVLIYFLHYRGINLIYFLIIIYLSWHSNNYLVAHSLGIIDSEDNAGKGGG